MMMKIILEENLSEDITQETFFRVWKKKMWRDDHVNIQGKRAAYVEKHASTQYDADYAALRVRNGLPPVEQALVQGDDESDGDFKKRQKAFEDKQKFREDYKADYLKGMEVHNLHVANATASPEIERRANNLRRVQDGQERQDGRQGNLQRVEQARRNNSPGTGT